MTRVRISMAALTLCLANSALAEAQEAAAPAPPAPDAVSPPTSPAPARVEPPAASAPVASPAPARAISVPAAPPSPAAAATPSPAAAADAELLDAYTTYAEDARRARFIGSVILVGAGAGMAGAGLALPEGDSWRIPLLVTGPIFVAGGAVTALVPSLAESNLAKLQAGEIQAGLLREQWKDEAEQAAVVRYVVGTLVGVIGAGVIGVGIWATATADAEAAQSGQTPSERRQDGAVLIGLGAVDVSCAAILLLFPTLAETSYEAYERRRKAGATAITRTQGPTWELGPAPLGIGLGARGTF